MEFSFLIGLFFLLLLGYLIILNVLGPDISFQPLLIGLSFGVGLGATTWAMFLLCALKIPLILTSLNTAIIILMVALLLRLLFKKNTGFFLPIEK